MGVVGEDLVRDRIDVLIVLILAEGKLNQIAGLQRRAVDGICAMFLEPWQDIGEIEYSASRCTDWVLEWLEGEGAEIVWESLKGLA